VWTYHVGRHCSFSKTQQQRGILVRCRGEGAALRHTLPRKEHQPHNLHNHVQTLVFRFSSSLPSHTLFWNSIVVWCCVCGKQNHCWHGKQCPWKKIATNYKKECRSITRNLDHPKYIRSIKLFVPPAEESWYSWLAHTSLDGGVRRVPSLIQPAWTPEPVSPSTRWQPSPASPQLQPCRTQQNKHHNILSWLLACYQNLLKMKLHIWNIQTYKLNTQCTGQHHNVAMEYAICSQVKGTVQREPRTLHLGLI
jgi:hypothetical protein